MAHTDRPATPTKTDPDAAAPQPADVAGEACGTCDPNQKNPAGPVREAGGTTGAGNLSPMQANRTGGATDGVPDAGTGMSPPRRGVEPDA